MAPCLPDVATLCLTLARVSASGDKLKHRGIRT
jgi:hypothetical protein